MPDKSATSIPLSLYIHVPWCVRKCEYCDFNSHARRKALPEIDYLAALSRDIASERERVPDRQIISIFFGGGTPSLLSGGAVDSILAAVAKNFQLADPVEITLEANPGTVEASRFHDYRSAGVNRLSLGVQSFRLDQLKALGRIHDANAIYNAFNMARGAGFENINVDLMYGLPNDSEQGSGYDLKCAFALQPEHISWYQLTLEPDTPFHYRPPLLPDDDSLGQLQDQGALLLREAGYIQYEIAAFAKATTTCRHNLNYWEYGDYIGIGPGAHGKLSDCAINIQRLAKVRHPNEYMHYAGSQSAIETTSYIDKPERIFEFMMNALRLTGGFELKLFEQRTGLGRELVQHDLEAARRSGLLDIQGSSVKATERGSRFLNQTLGVFLPQEDRREGQA